MLSGSNIEIYKNTITGDSVYRFVFIINTINTTLLDNIIISTIDHVIEFYRGRDSKLIRDKFIGTITTKYPWVQYEEQTGIDCLSGNVLN